MSNPPCFVTGMTVLERAPSFLGLSLGLLGWQRGWAGSHAHAVSLVLLQPLCLQDSAEAEAGICDYCVGSVAPICCLGLGLSPQEWRASGWPTECTPFPGKPEGKPQPWPNPVTLPTAAHPNEFSGIRCLDIKWSRCRCVGWAKIFLCRSNMQLKPMIKNLM